MNSSQGVGGQNRRSTISENRNFGALQDPFIIILNMLCQLKSLMLPKIEKDFSFGTQTPHLLPHEQNQAKNETTQENVHRRLEEGVFQSQFPQVF